MRIFLALDEQGRTIIPGEIRSALSVKARDLILLEKTAKGTFELVPAELVPRDQLWFHHPEMQALLTDAEADFAAARAVRTETPKEAQAHLDSLK